MIIDTSKYDSKIEKVLIDTSKHELAVSKMTVAEIEWELENLKGLILDNDDRRDYAILTNELDRRKSAKIAGESWKNAKKRLAEKRHS